MDTFDRALEAGKLPTDRYLWNVIFSIQLKITQKNARRRYITHSSKRLARKAVTIVGPEVRPFVLAAKQRGVLLTRYGGADSV